MISKATFETPWGPGTVVVEGGRLVEVMLPRVDVRPATDATSAGGPDEQVFGSGGADASTAAPAKPPAEVAVWWARELGEYFHGGRREWTDEEVHLESYGFTPFRTAVYRALLNVPAGSTITYGELARQAGRPGAARAVGSAMAENPIAIVVPCHRVVRNDGSLGHYGFGDPWKLFLLQMEGSRT